MYGVIGESDVADCVISYSAKVLWNIIFPELNLTVNKFKLEKFCHVLAYMSGDFMNRKKLFAKCSLSPIYKNLVLQKFGAIFTSTHYRC